jgi:hypothetical protein
MGVLLLGWVMPNRHASSDRAGRERADRYRRPTFTRPLTSRRRYLVTDAALVLAVLLGGCGAANSQPQTLTAASAGGMATPSSRATQTSEGGQVTIDVTCRGVQAEPSFAVAMNTHSVDLDGVDLQHLASLRVDNGPALQPNGWDAPKGGHHRSGTLTFPTAGADGAPMIGPVAQSVELVIRNVAGVPERTFTWST